MLRVVALVIALAAGIAIIVAVMFQASKADGFSAALGGADTSRSREGSREAWLEKIAKVGAVVWVLACLAVAILWYKYR